MMMIRDTKFNFLYINDRVSWEILSKTINKFILWLNLLIQCLLNDDVKWATFKNIYWERVKRKED